MVSPNQFMAQLETDTVSHYGKYVDVRSGTTNDEITANFSLPAGAIITGMTAYGQDTSAVDDPTFAVYSNCPGGSYNGSGTAPYAAVTAGFTNGDYAVASATSNLVIDNSDCTYYVYADTSGSSTDVDELVYGVALRWKRQVSPGSGRCDLPRCAGWRAIPSRDRGTGLVRHHRRLHRRYFFFFFFFFFFFPGARTRSALGKQLIDPDQACVCKKAAHIGSLFYQWLRVALDRASAGALPRTSRAKADRSWVNPAHALSNPPWRSMVPMA